jgi:hypothetical protein
LVYLFLNLERILENMARIKNIEGFCSFCNATTKMELSGDSNLGKDDTRKWAKCKKCKQMVLVEFEVKDKASKETIENEQNEKLKVYSPKASFLVGDAIYHQGWDDTGVVLSKELLSNGVSSILVKFSKSGQKQLIETNQ